MIASLGYYRYKFLSPKKKRELFNYRIAIDSNLKLEEIALRQRMNFIQKAAIKSNT